MCLLMGRFQCNSICRENRSVQYTANIYFLLLSSFFQNASSCWFLYSMPHLKCYPLWIAKKLYNAVRLFLSLIKGYRKTHFWTRIQKDMWSSFLSIQILRNWCICRSQTLHIVKYETIRYTASQILRCLKTNQLI